ncbi:aminopeptidase [Sedimentibacter sp. zth1]|uniref:aminopeptidase n=1 Tax=Sedimentibacter sp. zth1 TaxID=2816908 RepID=UPI001A939377|nr:aminopeptidase [Sedimentibacter sp. zth1]QSX05222.1 aminopeptidase [Sedimentibacter sp. zth1]
MNLNEKLMEYAELAVKTGVNIQKDQILVLQCPVEYAEFARMITKCAYEAGAKEVVVSWKDEKLGRLKFDYAPLEVFENVPNWKASFYNDYAKQNAAFMNVLAEDPEIFKGVSSEKLLANVKASEIALKDYRDCFDKSELQWNLFAVPNVAWAKKIFPDLDEKEAIEKLWEAIFKTVHIGKENPVEAWKKHDANLVSKCNILNEKQFAKLHYENSLGTDFVVGMPKNHIWAGGGESNTKGIRFFPNMPTEEVFTAPDCRYADGKVVSSMPLSYQGTLINNFSVTFKDGKVVDFDAKEGYEALERLLNTDEGSRRLGEVALVPYDSAISNMGILFYNTLFDENASCHFAFGKCYPNTIKGGELLSKEDLKKIGGNDSMNHVDFMVGTKDLKVTGIEENGNKTVIFEKGNWAI